MDFLLVFLFKLDMYVIFKLIKVVLFVIIGRNILKSMCKRFINVNVMELMYFVLFKEM